MIRDLRPNATSKWREGIIDGYTHQPHIDHILPCPQITSDTDNSFSTSTPSHQGDDIMMPLADPKLGEDINDHLKW